VKSKKPDYLRNNPDYLRELKHSAHNRDSEDALIKTPQDGRITSLFRASGRRDTKIANLACTFCIGNVHSGKLHGSIVIYSVSIPTYGQALIPLAKVSFLGSFLAFAATVPDP
jgi:hypothetical protein